MASRGTHTRHERLDLSLAGDAPAMRGYQHDDAKPGEEHGDGGDPSSDRGRHQMTDERRGEVRPDLDQDPGRGGPFVAP
jgi:hypothetical protein